MAPFQRAVANEFDPFDDVDRVGVYEVWGGADASARAWYAYSGVTVAPFSDIHADGLRLRMIQGVGEYKLEYGRTARKGVSDLLVGYQFAVDDITVKFFAGWSVLATQFRNADLSAGGVVVEHGPKLATEVWLDWSESAWASFDVNYSIVRETAAARLRIGQRVDNEISAGPEVVYNRTTLTPDEVSSPDPSIHELGNTRFGAFVRYDWFGGEFSASAGLSIDIAHQELQVKTDRLSPYAAFTLLMQF
ncbi:MAG: cellulose biosynthesis protein BcsS [Hyphomicrobiaceae bacterium]|nr:cellulose biosynthesis protein BcsS [Hyphomicrobiaceae bacterium]